MRNVNTASHNLVQKLRTQGGFTYSTQQRTPKSGYMVSRKGYGRQLNAGIDDRVLASHIDEYIVLTNTTGGYIGAWIDGDTIYLDVSDWCATKDVAEYRASEQEQIAYFDLENQEAVRVQG